MSVKIRRFSGKKLCRRKFVHDRKEKCGGDGGKSWQTWVDETFVSAKRKHPSAMSLRAQGKLSQERVFQLGL